MDFVFSEEQEIILKAFQNGDNVSINAVAGAGKTTASLLLAQENPSTEFFLLTYSRNLSDGTKAKIETLNITNIEVQTYHGCCTKYYGPSHNDNTLAALVNAYPVSEYASARLKRFQVVIIDELQDMNELYYNFIRNKLQHFNEKIQMVILGEPPQTIFQYNGGNPKYLLDAETYWGRKFTKCYLETSYRLTPNITEFVNTLVCSKYPIPFKMKCLQKAKNPMVEYHWTDIYYGTKNIVQQQIREFGVNNIIIMAFSLKEKTPIVKLFNDLSADGTPICVLKDDQIVDTDILLNKLTGSSVHKQKGREKQCVIAYGFDCSYHKYYARGKPIEEYLNLIYVELTRSFEKLVIIGDKKHGYLKNWKPSEISSLIGKRCLKVYGKPLNKCDCTLEYKCECPTQKTLNVTDLIKYRPFNILTELTQQPAIKITNIKGREMEISSETKATMKSGLVEQVSNIYGVLIPIIAEFYTYHSIKMIDYIVSDQFMIDFADSDSLIRALTKDIRYEMFRIYDKIRKSFKASSNESDSFDDRLVTLIDNNLANFGFLTVCVLCYDSYTYLLHQIDNYDWIENQYVIDCCKRLLDFRKSLDSGHEPASSQYETRVNLSFETICQHDEKVDDKLRLYGRVDDLCDRNDGTSRKNVIEYKVSKNLGDNSHIVQLLLYLWIMKSTKGFIYYPNLDTTIVIDITDSSKFLTFTETWFDKVLREYYIMGLKSLSKAEPDRGIAKYFSKSVPASTGQRRVIQDSDDEIDEEELNIAKIYKSFKKNCLL
jgi:hypothetical protein